MSITVYRTLSKHENHQEGMMENQISLFGSIRLTCEHCGARLEMVSNYNEREVLNISIKKHYCVDPFSEVKSRIVIEERDGEWFAFRQLSNIYFGNPNWYTRQTGKGSTQEEALYNLGLIGTFDPK